MPSTAKRIPTAAQTRRCMSSARCTPPTRCRAIPPGRVEPVRVQFVDCRWELGEPGWGRAQDLAAWGGPLRGGEEAVEAAEFVPRERPGDIISAPELVRRLADPSLVLVDARTPNRWRGEQNPVDDPPGRIPGALNAPWAEPEP